jgi:hypothetical protein
MNGGTLLLLPKLGCSMTAVINRQVRQPKKPPKYFTWENIATFAPIYFSRATIFFAAKPFLLRFSK